MQARLPELSVPQGFSAGFGNEVEEQAESFRELQLVLILAIVLVYTVMASQYESLRDPFIIMFSIPLAAIGVVGRCSSPTRPSACRLISASSCWPASSSATRSCWSTTPIRCGIATGWSCVRRLKSQAAPAAPDSDDPVCTMLGLVPMSLGIGEGSELQVPLARVVIGGLLTSTLITLVFVPRCTRCSRKAGAVCSSGATLSRTSRTESAVNQGPDTVVGTLRSLGPC